MQRQPSLTLRLSVLLLAGQLFSFAITMVGLHLAPLVSGGPATAVKWNYLAEMRARIYVANSIVRMPTGELQIEPSPQLRELVRAHPSLQYAVFDPSSGAALTGSSPELAAALKGHSGIIADEMRDFRMRHLLDGELSGSYILQETPFGRLTIATHGYVFEWRDFFYHIGSDIVDTLKESAFTILFAIGIGWITLSKGLATLQAVAQQVSRVDISSLSERIPLGRTPQEIAPLVETVNDAFSRLEAGVKRQHRFLANAAHELRTPLTIMNARINGPERPELKRELDRDVRRLRNIVEQLLVYARLGKSDRVTFEQLNLSAIVEAIVDDYALIAVKNSRNVEYRTSVESFYVKGDRRAIESVVGNLIDNALRAEPTGGVVSVRVTETGVEVIDHGAGIPDEEKLLVFEPFWRKEEAASGSGLGLAIAKELVEEMGGQIWVEDTDAGGATFKLKFPRLLDRF